MGKFLSFSKIEGRGQKKESKIQIRTFENRWGGVGIFQKSLSFKYFDHMGRWGPYRTTSEIQKSLKLIRKGGAAFFK